MLLFLLSFGLVAIVTLGEEVNYKMYKCWCC